MNIKPYSDFVKNKVQNFNRQHMKSPYPAGHSNYIKYAGLLCFFVRTCN